MEGREGESREQRGEERRRKRMFSSASIYSEIKWFMGQEHIKGKWECRSNVTQR